MNNTVRGRLLNVTAIANDYCNLMQTAPEVEKTEFIQLVTALLPRIYFEFQDISLLTLQQPIDDDNEQDIDPDALLDLEEEEEKYYSSYVDEDFYESIRRHIEMLLGPEDVFLETFEEDMKYSDTPIAASISESLADIFQPLYNFISIVKDSEGTELKGAFMVCQENFKDYWAQTLCNVMRPLNHLRYH